MILNDLINEIKHILKKGEIENYETEALFITEKATGFNRTQLILNSKTDIDEAAITAAISMAEKRLSGIPVQYCIGEWDFMGETFKVGEGVLIPRPETEELCEYVIDTIRNTSEPTVIDLCSGSGCIGLSIKKNIPDCRVFLVEKSKVALKYLTENAENLCKNQCVSVINGDVLRPDDFSDMLKKADVIVSNPPYIKTNDIPNLQKEVQFEPKMALDGGNDGYDFYRVICRDWAKYLKDDGFIALECGEEQAEYICALFDENIFETEIIKDFAAINRFVIGRKRQNDFRFNA